MGSENVPGATDEDGESMIEYVGYVWRKDQQRIDFKIEAKSRQDAKRGILARYGEDVAISIWSEEDAKRLR